MAERSQNPQKPRKTTKGARARTKTPHRKRIPKVGFMQRAARAAEIASMRAQAPPIAWAEIARKVGLDASSCRDAYAEWLRWRETESDPTRVVDETIALFNGLIATLALIVDDENAPENARVGAARAALDATNNRFGLLLRAGRVPQRLHAFTGGLEVDEAWREWLDLLRRHEIPDAVVQDFAALRRRMAVAEQPAIEGSAS